MKYFIIIDIIIINIIIIITLFALDFSERMVDEDLYTIPSWYKSVSVLSPTSFSDWL